MGARRLFFPALVFLYVLALWYLNGQRPYEAFSPGPGQDLAYWLFKFSLYYIPAVIAYRIFFRSKRNHWSNFIVGMTVVVFATQLILSLAFLFIDIGFGMEQYFTYLKGEQILEKTPDQLLFQKQMSLWLTALPFGYFIFGITKGKYNYQVNNIPLTFPDLPEAFHGFRLVQISDIHSGSFDSLEGVRKGIKRIAEQAADLFVFTGDLVNGHADEILPYAPYFKELTAPYGKYAVTGNHDYSWGGNWGNKEAWRANVQAVQSNYGKCGFELLNNRAITLTKGKDSIHLIGVENWGKPPFPQYGDLDKALETVPAKGFKILLSHDPSHWDEKTLPHPKPVHLTLSGHTHGMQFGINWKLLKWSPIQFVYPRWAGLYEEAKQFLYVNRGFGWLAFPGRIGMYPEISVFELRREGL